MKKSIAASIERYNSKETSSCRKNEPCYSLLCRRGKISCAHSSFTSYNIYSLHELTYFYETRYAVYSINCWLCFARARIHKDDRRSRMQMKKISHNVHKFSVLGRMTFNGTFFRAVLAPFSCTSCVVVASDPFFFPLISSQLH